MRKRLWIGAAVFCAATLCLAAALTIVGEQRTISDKLIRFHVVAASDSERDQQEKLQVRDAMLSVIRGQDFSSREQAKTWLSQHTPELEWAANACLRENGDGRVVQVSLREESFPTRHYETFSLPAGKYLSLRAVIGEGRGHNWWCCVYPAICMPSAQDPQQSVAAFAGFTAGEVALLTEDSPQITVRFKVLEWIERAESWLAKKTA